MPTMWQQLRCNACDYEFEYMAHDQWDAVAEKTIPDTGPKFCQNCGYDFSDTELEHVLSAPHIGTLKSRVPDQLYRQSEKGAAFRAEIAGDPSLKITDQRTARYEGETAAVPVVNDVTKAMTAAAPPPTTGLSHFGHQGTSPAAAMQLAAGAHTGPHAHAGLRAMGAVRQDHAAAASDHRGVSSEIVTKEIHDRDQMIRSAPRAAGGFRGR